MSSSQTKDVFFGIFILLLILGAAAVLIVNPMGWDYSHIISPGNAGVAIHPDDPASQSFYDNYGKCGCYYP